MHSSYDNKEKIKSYKTQGWCFPTSATYLEVLGQFDWSLRNQQNYYSWDGRKGGADEMSLCETYPTNCKNIFSGYVDTSSHKYTHKKVP